VKPLSIEGCSLFTPCLQPDSRGINYEWFKGGMDAVQANCIVSYRGVVRGIHFAENQSKFVTCVRGGILDVAVDIRVGSPTYGRFEMVTLDDGSRQSLFLAVGLGHALMTLSDEAHIVYLNSTPWVPDKSWSINPVDPAIGIPWPEDIEIKLSEKDWMAPTLEEMRRSGLLPVYGETT